MKTSVKDINIKSRTYYFLNSTTYVENFDPSNIKIDEKLYKNILIYYIGYVTIKRELKMYSINSLYLIFSKLNGYFEKMEISIYVENFDPSNIKIDEKLYKNILIYYIGYVTIKRELKMYSINSLYLIFSKLNGYFEKMEISI